MSFIFFIQILFVLATSQTLRFNNNGSFKIVQFTDLHFGEAEDTLWGPMQDVNSTRVMRTILKAEMPDLIVFTGDLITGNNIQNNATEYWKQALTPAIEFAIPWASLFGNHDDLANGTEGSREDLMNFDISFNLSLSKMGPNNIHGVSNYVIPILSSKGDKNSSYIYILDSGGQDCLGAQGWGCIWPDQVEWYTEQSMLFTKLNNGDPVPSVAFFHIPLQEQMLMWNTDNVYGTNNDSVACQALNSGIYSAFAEMGDVKYLSVGHNHGNDYCGYYASDNIQLCFGRHSGYGGYGTWERGARVLQLNEDPFSFSTWIRFEDGRVAEQGDLHQPSPPYQSNCT